VVSVLLGTTCRLLKSPGGRISERVRNTWLTPIGQPATVFKSNIFYQGGSMCSLVDIVDTVVPND
jgi:hypothetical protein